ncbi:MAG: YceI family protein [Leptothrix sp. (in: b-proteobacteria)]
MTNPFPFTARALLATAALVLSAGVSAQTKVDVAKSDIGFTSKQMGVPVDGKFKKFDAQITLDPKKPETGKVAFSIDLGSATLGNKETDAELVKPDWFNVPRFPQATFASSAIKGLGGGKFEVSGKLTIKGASHDVVVPVALTQAAGVTTANGAFAIKRLDFKIGDGDWADTSMVANDVQVKFKLLISGLAPL